MPPVVVAVAVVVFKLPIMITLLLPKQYLQATVRRRIFSCQRNLLDVIITYFQVTWLNYTFCFYSCGYPDPGYLDRLKSQLAEKQIIQPGQAARP